MAKRCAINMLAIRNEDPDLLRAIVRGRGRRFEIYGGVKRGSSFGHCSGLRGFPGAVELKQPLVPAD